MTKHFTLRFLGWTAVLLLFTPMYRQCNGLGMQEEKPEEVAASEHIAPTFYDSLRLQKVDSVPNQIEEADVVCVPEKRTFWEETGSFVTQLVFVPFDDRSDNANMMSFRFVSEVWDFVANTGKEVENFRLKSEEKRLEWICLHLRCLFVFAITVQTWLFAIRSGRLGKWPKRLVVSNLIFLFLAAVATSFDPRFETWDQFRWGSYLFLMVQLALLFLLSKQVPVRSKS